MKRMKNTIAAIREGALDLCSLIYTLRRRSHPTPIPDMCTLLAERHVPHVSACGATLTDGARLQLVNERREEALIKAVFHKFRPMGRLNSRRDCVLATAHGSRGVRPPGA